MNLRSSLGILSYSQINHPLIPSSSESEPGLVRNMNIPWFKATRIFMVARKWSHRIHRTGMFTYIYHKKSTIHVGKYYAILPWILAEKMGLGERAQFSKPLRSLWITWSYKEPLLLHPSMVQPWPWQQQTSFWKEKTSRKNEDPIEPWKLGSFPQGIVFCFFLTKCLIFQGEKNRSIFLTHVNCTAFFLRARTNQINLYTYTSVGGFVGWANFDR